MQLNILKRRENERSSYHGYKASSLCINSVFLGYTLVATKGQHKCAYSKLYLYQSMSISYVYNIWRHSAGDWIDNGKKEGYQCWTSLYLRQSILVALYTASCCT